MERYAQMYLSKSRENVPCNWMAVAAFFVVFVLLDHIRGLGTLIGLLVLLPLHCNKRAGDDIRPLQVPAAQNLMALCTEQPGVHRSCSALYFWCASNGIIQSLALTLHGPVENHGVWVYRILLFLLWGMTLFVSALLIDSLSPAVATVATTAPVDEESPAPVTRFTRHSTIASAPQ